MWSFTPKLQVEVNSLMSILHSISSKSFLAYRTLVFHSVNQEAGKKKSELCIQLFPTLGIWTGQFVLSTANYRVKYLFESQEDLVLWAIT